MKIYYYSNGQFEKATGDSIFAESANSNVVQMKLPMAINGSVVYATFLLPFSQGTDQYGQYKAESLLLKKVVDEQDGGFMYEGILAGGYLVNSGVAYISARLQLPAGVTTYTASSATAITLGETAYVISYTATTPALLKLTSAGGDVFEAIDTNSIMVGDTIYLIGEDGNGRLTLTTDIIIKSTEQVEFTIQSGGGYSATSVLPELGEQLAVAIASIETDIYNLAENKQDKVDVNIDASQSWQTSTTVVTAINNIIGQVATNKSNIALNTGAIADNANEIATIKQQMITGETYIGTTRGSTLPTGAQLTQYVETTAGRSPKGGDYVYFILEISGETDKNYKYIYSSVDGWSGAQIPSLEEAGNGSLGIIEGTYNVGSTNSTIVDIVGGKILNIYIKDDLGNYRNIVEYASTLNSTIEGIIAGTQSVGKAIQAIKDELGNDIIDTYLTKTAGATKQYVRQYALPREFNDIYFISADGYSLDIPTTPVSGVQFSLETSAVGDFQVFQVSKRESADYELSNKNSARTVIYVATDVDCDVQFRLTTQAQKTGGAWQTLGVDLTQVISLVSGNIMRVEFTEPFTSLGNNVISITDGDLLRQTLEVVTNTSATINFDVYSNATYASSFALNTQTMVFKTVAGNIGQEQTITAIGEQSVGSIDFQVTAGAILYDSTSAEFVLNYGGVVGDNDVITMSLDSQNISVETPYGGDTLGKYLKQCYFETDGSSRTTIRFKGFINIDNADNISIKIEEDNFNAISYGANLSLSGNELQLKDQKGNSIGSPVTLPETGIVSVQESGAGNAFTSQSVSGGVLTLTKGETFATPDDVANAINSVRAYYITRNSDGDPFQTYAQLSSASTFYSGGQERTPTTNDYCVVLADITQGTVVAGYSSFTNTADYVGYYVLYNNESVLVTHANKDSVGITAGSTVCYLFIPTTRYVYQGDQWEFQWKISDSSLTADQWATVNSGLTSADKTKLDGIASGAQVNAIESVSVDGTALTPDANKNVNIDLTGKLDKVTGTSSNSRLYGISTTGVQTNPLYSADIISNGIVARNTNGQIKVPATPTANEHATSKQYVDGAIKDSTVTLTNDGETLGAFTLNQSANETIDLGFTFGIARLSE